MPKNTKRITIYTLLALVFAEILWGANKPVIKLGLETVPLPIYLSVTVMGAALLIAPLAFRDWKRLNSKDYTILIIGSLISITLGNVALLLGLQKVPAVNASLIGLFAPLILFILSVQFLREKLSLKTFIDVLDAESGNVLQRFGIIHSGPDNKGKNIAGKAHELDRSLDENLGRSLSKTGGNMTKAELSDVMKFF